MPETDRPISPSCTNSGHGHVFPRPDGVRARCGGPRLCGSCRADEARKAAETPTPRQPRVWLPGDTVPPGVAVADGHLADGEFWPATELPSRFARPVVELHLPDVDAAVVAEKARRRAAEVSA